MKNQHISQLESKLEKLVEGTFASLFGRKIRVQDLALKLARAMEDGISYHQDPRPVAPDQYQIYTHPEVHEHLTSHYPHLIEALGEHLIELASQSGFRIISHPRVQLFADPNLEIARVIVYSNHSNYQAISTAAMQRVSVPTTQSPVGAQLIIEENRTFQLDQEVVNIGRSPDNHIILEDPHVSRNHIQLRLRFNSYWLFDAGSQGGTLVNGTRVIEHRLKSGDVIVVGKTKILYAEDDPAQDIDLDSTEAFEPPL